ncbi:hypothetical protein NAEGRDRAFT_49321 [Naegleria gruberi]|uniref:Tetratricopeptide SHNi-TPR domain-containing protein n=1 Tax=Naegleria gruberi TaxID=5762 RepID=D2VGD7_NAEGR|nr:uncharacterized protein NAEGRDRAFT_49321 [Naegleria gruberi]EFC43946.1 hypothetical protein NAEGRDRAFT_49321 [Naegleria gruberi]|eukprot:XP_002676690.1 hypothetical protein NAEGRDRAFT_49321 [Naegleria gruberi strain NEG-M]
MSNSHDEELADFEEDIEETTTTTATATAAEVDGEEDIEDEEEHEEGSASATHDEVPLEEHLVMNQDDIVKAIGYYEEYKTRKNASAIELVGEELQEALSLLDEGIELLGNNVVRDREEQYGESSIECAEVLIVYAEMLIERGRYQVDNIISGSLKKAIKKNMDMRNEEEVGEEEEEEDEDCFELAWGVLELARVAFVRILVSGKVLSPSELQLNYRLKLARVHTLLAVLNSENDNFNSAVVEYQNALKLYDIVLKDSDNLCLGLFRVAANIFHKRDDLKVDLLQKIAETHLEIATCLSMGGSDVPPVLEAYKLAETALENSVKLREKAIDNDKSIIVDLKERIAELNGPSVPQEEVSRVINQVVTNRMGSVQSGFAPSSSEPTKEVHILQPRKRKIEQSTIQNANSSETKKTKEE